MCCRICPIFQVSNVTGENLELVKMFLNLLSCRMDANEHKPAEFLIDDTYQVPVRTPANNYESIVCNTFHVC